MPDPWLIDLDRLHASYSLLIVLGAAGLLAFLLHRLGLIRLALRLLGFLVRKSIGGGFALWRRLLAWAPWPLFLAVVVAFLAVGLAAVSIAPAVAVLFALTPLCMGVTACLAYMHIDLERYAVGRGYKAAHNPSRASSWPTT
jgi:hypothetical protein